MKYHVIIAVTITLLAIVVSASMVSAASDWNIPVSGPDGEIQVDMTTIKDLIPELGITIQIDGENKTGIPLWRIIRLVDSKKTLGPGDIIKISAKTPLEIPFQGAYKNDAYLVGVDDSKPVLLISTENKESLISEFSSIGTSTTDNWIITISSKDTKTEISKENWNNLAKGYRKEKTDYNKRIFSGIPIYRIIESRNTIPGPQSVIRIIAQDRYSVDIPWEKISGNEGYLLSDTMNNEVIPKFIEINEEYGKTPAWPLMLIDPDFPSENSVGNVIEIQVL